MFLDILRLIFKENLRRMKKKCQKNYNNFLPRFWKSLNLEQKRSKSWKIPTLKKRILKIHKSDNPQKWMNFFWKIGYNYFYYFVINNYYTSFVSLLTKNLHILTIHILKLFPKNNMKEVKIMRKSTSRWSAFVNFWSRSFEKTNFKLFLNYK